MQENNNENKKTLNENDANDVMQNSEIQKQMIQKKQMLLLSVKKMFPKAN